MSTRPAGAADAGGPGADTSVRRTAVRRGAQLGLLVAGVVLLAGLVRTIGLDQVAADLRGFGWGFALVIGLELVIDGCNTLGWRRTLPPRHPVGLLRLFWIRLAGTAINQLTPTATVGGEFVKAMFLRPYLRTAETVACLIAARMSYAIGQAALVLVGMTALLGRLERAPELALAIVAGFAVTLAGVLGFIALQRRGIFTALAAHAARLGLRPATVTRLHTGSAALDHHLGVLYRERPFAFAVSVGWHFVGQLVGLLQLWCILSWLGSPAPLMTCLAIEAFAVVADSAMFFVPGRVGVQEGGRVLVFTALGMSAATGLAAALIVRLAQLASASVGLAAYAGLTLDRRGAVR